MSTSLLLVTSSNLSNHQIYQYFVSTPMLFRLCTVMESYLLGYLAHAMQNWLGTKCPDCITEDQWPSQLLDLNPLHYHVWKAMLEAYHKCHPEPKTSNSMKHCRWSGTACLREVSKVTEGFCWHFEYLQWLQDSDFLLVLLDDFILLCIWSNFFWIC